MGVFDIVATAVEGSSFNGEILTSVEDAMSAKDKPKWVEAMKNELESLSKHGTYDVVDPPKGRKMETFNWVFDIKRDANGKVQRYKALLVATGLSQRKGVDYEELYSLVTRYESFRY